MKKIFTLFMMLLLLPCVMSAVENAIYVGGEELIGTDSSPVYAKTVNGAVITDGASENDYHVKWNGSVLTLNGVNIQGNDHEDAAIFYENGDLDIELVGENTVIGVDKNKSGMVFSYGIRTTAGNIKIRGTGSLQVKGGNVEAQYGNAYSYGINASGSIEVSAGSVISEGGSSSFVSTGIYAIENVQISGGVIRAIGADALTQSYGIWTSNGGVSISGGEVTAMSGNVENIESKSYGILTSDGGVSISGGEVTAMSGKGTGSNSMTAGIYAIGNVQILGGVIRAIGANAHTQSYGILTSNGGVSISGGEVTAMSGNVESTKSDSESSGVRAKTNISIVPQDGKVIAVKVGESEENVAEISGSPFSEETELTEINDKCFYSKENDHLHRYGDPTYEWSEDNTACTAKRVCQHDSEHSQTATATVTSKQTKAPACTEKGEMTYTATFSVDVDWAEKQTKTEDIPATGHGETEIQNAKEVTCTVDGYTGDEVCTVCGEVVTAGEIIPATGHHYVNGYCTECGHRDPDYRPDPISYYNIYVEDVCDGVEVSTSKQVVREGGSITVYVEKDTANYTFDNFKVYYKRSYYGGWEELKEGTQPGE
ncbi:MAG: carbohydrate-binding domain-containing protein, partial [Parabacteroides sp.]|nr:carbohydrate-binding domain-containing protein [Parabacteroides sp.]